jgi:hypothetical protein
MEQDGFFLKIGKLLVFQNRYGLQNKTLAAVKYEYFESDRSLVKDSKRYGY